MNKIILHNITVDDSLVMYQYTISEELKQFLKHDAMFLRYEQKMTDVPLSILTIPFVNCMSGLSWLADAKLFVDEIDKSYYNALKQVKLAFSEHHGVGLKGQFVPSVIKKNEVHENDKYLLLFSGGIDCQTSFLRHKDDIGGVVNIYGWARDKDEISKVDHADKKKTSTFANQFGINAYHVTSNFASQFNLDEIDKVFCSKLGTSYWYGFLHPMAFLAISTPVAWLNGFSSLMIASSFTKERADFHCGSFITTDSEYRFATNGMTLHDGFELNRQQKVELIVDYQRKNGSQYYIQACSFNDHNCCLCEKCFRTIVELIAENADPKDFGFNISGSMCQYWKSVIDKDVALWAVAKEGYYYYDDSKKRMLENYENIEDKEFVDWFLNFDFDKAKRKGLMRYYRKNFFSILKRKLHL